MADLAVWQRTIVDEKGDIIPGAEIEVRSYPGGSLITLYRGPDGAQIKGNPFRTGEDGFARFWAESQRAEIIAHGAGSTIRWIVDLLNADEVIGDAVTEATAAAAVAVSEAEAAADRAEAARDAAQLNAHIYPDTAAGLAATTDGDYFSVPSDDSDEYLILYRNDSGSAEEVARYPSAEAVETLTGNATIANDWDAITRSGFYINTTNGAVGIPASRRFLTLLHIEKDSGFAHQLAVRQHPDTPQMWLRTRGGSSESDPATWGEWHEIAYKSDAVSPLTTESNDWNEVNRTGYYRNSSGSAVGLPANFNDMTMMHIERDDGGAEQMAFRQSPSTLHMWRRMRGFSSGEWSDWAEILNEHSLTAREEQDWDSITRSGFYYNSQSGSAVGIPIQAQWLTLQHIEKPNGFAHQIAIRQNPDDPKMWLRIRGGAGASDPPDWSEWTRILVTSDLNNTLGPIRAVDEVEAFTDDISGGTWEQRPGITNYTVFMGGSGPALRFNNLPCLVARRRPISLGPDVGDPQRKWRVQFVTGTPGARAGRAAFSVAWYKNDLSPCDTPTTEVEVIPEYTEGVSSHVFTVSRAFGADVVAPSDAYFFSPYVEVEERPQGGGAFLLLYLYVSDATWSGEGQGEVDIDEGLLHDLNQVLETTPRRGELKPLQILPVTEAEAAALTGEQRMEHEWYYLTDKTGEKLTHRSDLPSMSSQVWALSTDLPGGSLDEDNSYISDSPDVVTLAASNALTTARRRVALVRVTGALGKSPVVLVDRSRWEHTDKDEYYHLVWGLDPDGDEWHFFDNMERDEDYLTFTNDQPFESDTIYLANGPRWTPGRYEKRVSQWIAHPFTRPTDSAEQGYYIGSIPERSLPAIGKTAPKINARAFVIGTGEKKVALTSGIHPDEFPGHYIFEGSVEALLSVMPWARELREKFSFYCYPQLNAQGLWAGATRVDVQSEIDANRIWGDEEVESDMVDLYMNAWSKDLGGNFAAAFDFHSWPNSSLGSPGPRALWYRTDISEEDEARDAFLSALSGYGSYRTNSTFTNDYTVNYAMRSLGAPKLVMTAEYAHDTSDGVQEWREFGRDLMKTLFDIRSLF